VGWPMPMPKEKIEISILTVASISLNFTRRGQSKLSEINSLFNHAVDGVMRMVVCGITGRRDVHFHVYHRLLFYFAIALRCSSSFLLLLDRLL
jgi:hypothetical protein